MLQRSQSHCWLHIVPSAAWHCAQANKTCWATELVSIIAAWLLELHISSAPSTHLHVETGFCSIHSAAHGIAPWFVSQRMGQVNKNPPFKPIKLTRSISVDYKKGRALQEPHHGQMQAVGSWWEGKTVAGCLLLPSCHQRIYPKEFIPEIL